MQFRAPWRGPSAEELKTVAQAMADTNVLTVKDASTGKLWPDEHKKPRWQQMPAYGVPFAKKNDGTAHIPGIGSIVRSTMFVRSVETRLVGSARCPQGIVIGGCEVWVRNTAEGYEGDQDFACVDFRRDICTEEMYELTAWAHAQTWVTRTMIEAADAEAAELRQHKTRTQRDPVGVTANAIKEGFAQAMAELRAPHTVAGPTPEQLKALGLRWNAEKGVLEKV